MIDIYDDIKEYANSKDSGMFVVSIRSDSKLLNQYRSELTKLNFIETVEGELSVFSCDKNNAVKLTSSNLGEFTRDGLTLLEELNLAISIAEMNNAT